MRLLPDFIIIGAQRAGTTSLFNYLAQHPNIYPSFPKEVHYFSNNYQKGLTWYRSHFPLIWHRQYVACQYENCYVTGEATPFYLSHPLAPRRLKGVLPDIRLIVLLRNPIDRAYSHYHHEVKMGFENLSFEEAIQQEPVRLGRELDKMSIDEEYRSFNYQHYSYISRGIYVDQLIAWFQNFNQEQFLILKSEDFYNNPQRYCHQVARFLGLSGWKWERFDQFNSSRYEVMNKATREQLSQYYRTYNNKLYEYLSIDFGWDS